MAEITRDDLFERCPECESVQRQSIQPRDYQPIGPGPVAWEQGQCQRCNGHGRILTATGRALKELVAGLNAAKPML